MVHILVTIKKSYRALFSLLKLYTSCDDYVRKKAESESLSCRLLAYEILVLPAVVIIPLDM